MVPNLSKPGYSFKFVSEYFDHDKKRKKTRHRVEWTTTRNLMAYKAKTIVKIMIATAMDADRLKARSGVKATGGKSAKHVQTLSLSWHPGEEVTREEMEEVIDEVIELLELQDHQVAIWSHNDTPHKHIHFLINRVNPWTGRMAVLSNAHRKLDRWANDYERRRGNVVSHNRDEKYQRMEAVKAIYPDDKKRNDYAKQNRAETAAAAKGKPVPKSDRWDALTGAEKAREAEEARIALQREQEATAKAQRALERAEKDRVDQDKRNADLKARIDRLHSEETDHHSLAVRDLFSPYTLDDTTYDPPGEWLRALALRVLDNEQRELRQMLEVDFKLDTRDPIALRKKFAQLTPAQGMQLVTSVDKLDREMDADPSRYWKQRRLAFDEMIEAHREYWLRPERTRHSPIEIFKTVIKNICECSGLKAFYDNVLVPLVNRVAKAIGFEPPLSSSKQNSSADPKVKPAGFDM